MAQKYRALLIGVPSYQDASIDDLPFVETDITELATALTAASYEVTVHDLTQTNRDSIDSAVEFFIGDSQPDDSLLIFLSGHGIHYSGIDYLVPSSAITRSFNFPSRCIPIDFDGYIERSMAGNTAIFIDACREGIKLLEKGAINAASWSERNVSRTSGRHLAYVYACSPGERARYANDGTTTYSLFSRVLSQVVRDSSGPATLAEIAPALQNALDRLTADYGFPVQRVRVLTESSTDDFVVVDRPGRYSPTRGNVHPWVAAVQDHVAWDQAAGDVDIDGIHEGTVELIDQLSRSWERDKGVLKDDPWNDVQFAERMNGKIRWLLSSVLNAEKLLLSPAEAALLVVFPFLREAYWTRATIEAHKVQPTNFSHREESGERARFEQFRAGYGRLCRRAHSAAKVGDSLASAGIGWWLFHFWLSRQATSYDTSRMSEFLDAVRPAGSSATEGLMTEVFNPARLIEFIRNLQLDTNYFTRTDREPSLRPWHLVASATELEQPIREQLISYILTAAYRFAIDAKTLPEVLVDHLGIAYAVDLTKLRDTVQGASWEARGRTRVLAALCDHPAVELSLRDHAGSVDSLLNEISTAAIDSTYLAPLMDMPTHATADRVGPGSDADGVRSYDSTELRFRLAEDRIQELLMGVQLYGDPALAIREMYQNALDACRYREARTKFLIKKGQRPTSWSGKIVFQQSVDDSGAPFLECRDNGIGMGMRELIAAFSYSGMRFADLPEYLEEHADWKAEGIELYPNSRFGIGVLSYFMLADDITVKTCRLDRFGEPGDLLEVQIAGPGALFKVRNLGKGEQAGTLIRLHLRSTEDALSTTDLLRRILWISDYDVEATDDNGTVNWKPGQLSAPSPIDLPQFNPYMEEQYADYEETHIRQAFERVDRTSTETVWWCNGEGAILADGLWAGSPLFGAVINLTGPYMPAVTVDRKRILSYDQHEVERMLRTEIPALVAEDASVLDHAWLSDLAESNLGLADEIARYAIDHSYQGWMIGDKKADVTVVGCLPADRLIFRSYMFSARYSQEKRRAGQLIRNLPERALDWRLLVWARTGLFGKGLSASATPEVPVAMPSDEVLLVTLSNTWPRQRISVPKPADVDPVSLISVAVVAAVTGLSSPEVCARLAALGFAVPDPAGLPERLTRDDAVLLSRDLDGGAPWIEPGPVSLGQLAATAARTRYSVPEVCARLAAFGFTVPDPAGLPEQIERDDVLLLRREDEFSSRQEWIDPDRMVPASHLAEKAVDGHSVPEVCTRLAALGFRLPAYLKVDYPPWQE